MRLAAALLAFTLSALALPKKKATSAPEAAGVVAPEIGVTVNTPVPSLSARDLKGEAVSLDQLFAQGPTLLVFYRGGWCPYCNHQMYALSQAAPDFAAAGVKLAAISVDKPDAASLTQASWSIPFPVLSDSELAVHEAFKVVFHVDAETRDKYKGWGIDLEAASGRTDGAIAVPSMFLVKDGAVAWAHTDPAYKVRPTPEQVLASLKAAGLP